MWLSSKTYSKLSIHMLFLNSTLLWLRLDKSQTKTDVICSFSSKNKAHIYLHFLKFNTTLMFNFQPFISLAGFSSHLIFRISKLICNFQLCSKAKPWNFFLDVPRFFEYLVMERNKRKVY